MYPKISIITVVRNNASALEVTLSNIVQFAYPNLELIVVDGASTDNTLHIAKSYSQTVTTLISEPDKGLYDAMNKGIKAATGDYIWFINAGDKVAITAHELTSKIDSMEGGWKNWDVIFGETMVIDPSGKALGLRRKRLPRRLTSRSLWRGMVVCHQSILVRRTTAPLYDLTYRYAADIDWVIESLERAERNSKGAFNLNAILSQFETGGISTNNRKASLGERYRIMTKRYGTPLTLFAHTLFVWEAVFKPDYRKVAE